MKYFLFLILLLPYFTIAQTKQAITHADYDKWESVGERQISKGGEYVVYVVNPQEGDGKLVLNNIRYPKTIKTFDRGYNALISNDEKYVFFKIKPFFNAARDAKIKKKKPDEMPKDSLGIYEIASDKLIKIPAVKSYKISEKGNGWLAYHLEKAIAEKPAPKIIDSVTQLKNLTLLSDSFKLLAEKYSKQIEEIKLKGIPKINDTASKQISKLNIKLDDEKIEEGTDLVLLNLNTLAETKYKLVTEYYFDKFGKNLLIETSKKNNDSKTKALVIWNQLNTLKNDTVLRQFNDAKNYTLDEAGTQLSFVAERDSSSKALQKFYKLFYYKINADSALVIADKNTINQQNKFTISADYINNFSKDGSKLFYGITPIRKPKDTTLVEFETAKLDIWNYNDDYLQPQQLVQLNNELKRSYLTVFHTNLNKHLQLGSDTVENILLINEGNAEQVLALTNKGNRKFSQWEGATRLTAKIINTNTGAIDLVFKNEKLSPQASPNGKFLIWFDEVKKHYFTYDITTKAIKNISSKINFPLYDEENDVPDNANAYGIMRWKENDELVYIYDKFDIWACDPKGIIKPKCLTKGRTINTQIRWQNTKPDNRYIKNNEPYLFSIFNKINKKSDVIIGDLNTINQINYQAASNNIFSRFVQSEDDDKFIGIMESSIQAPHIIEINKNKLDKNKLASSTYLSIDFINQHQYKYNWYTTQLENWKMLDGKMSEGILYKPENFDASKKYPIIFYFYERNADLLNAYKAPAPSASTINIAYFTSNGYIVFDPNIYYKNGEPGNSAYNAVVSAAKYLTKKYKWIDSTKMGIQGQSWGGYQVAYLVTKTNIFAAASAGAPVSNMTSAYGGIRWGTGISRQFQYEKGQSRIGKDLWKNTDAYLKNSPLFSAPNIKTPLLLMHNDKDGAVPWYQSIELFTALKRLDKKVWLLQYNDEDHNLVERKNRKDLSVRLAQFFDFYLKGNKQPKWMSDGVPATEKGIEWGL